MTQPEQPRLPAPPGGGLPAPHDPTHSVDALFDPVPKVDYVVRDLKADAYRRPLRRNWSPADTERAAELLRAGYRPTETYRWPLIVMVATIVAALVSGVVWVWAGRNLGTLRAILGVALVGWLAWIAHAFDLRDALTTPAPTVDHKIVHLPEHEQNLVKRAANAISRIRTSTAWQDGYLLGQRDLIDLPQHLAAIKARCAATTDVGHQVLRLQGQARTDADNVLTSVLDSIETRVVALETYDWHIGELDGHRRALAQETAVEGLHDTLSELIIATAADGHAVDHLTHLTEGVKVEAAAAREALAVITGDTATLASLTAADGLR